MRELKSEKYIAKMEKLVSQKNKPVGSPNSKQRRKSISYCKKEGQRIARHFRKMSHRSSNLIFGLDENNTSFDLKSHD